MIISKTPYRISFFGGGTDYPAWYQDHGGSVLSTTIDKYCYITVRHLPPFFEHTHRIVYSKIEDVKIISEIRHPAARAVLEFCSIKKGIEVHHDGDLPARSGIGSSSSFTVGLLHALHALKGSIVSKHQLAQEAIRIERDILKENVGSQDQVAVAFGGFNKINFGKDGSIRVDPVTLHNERIKELQLHCMLIFTGISRYASKIASAQVRNTPHHKEELQAMHDMVNRATDILNGTQDIARIGSLLDEGWQLKKRLSRRISTYEVDKIYEAALRSGATGGKLLGAGGGGFMLIFVPPEKRQKVKEALKDFLEVKFSFERTGSQIIYYSP